MSSQIRGCSSRFLRLPEGRRSDKGTAHGRLFDLPVRATLHMQAADTSWTVCSCTSISVGIHCTPPITAGGRGILLPTCALPSLHIKTLFLLMKLWNKLSMTRGPALSCSVTVSQLERQDIGKTAWPFSNNDEGNTHTSCNI